MTAKPTAARKLRNCLCQTFEFGVFDVETDDDYGTDCNQTTYNQFAQGHDAKLVGYMVRAELAGQEIRQGTHTFASAVQAAGSISGALALKAQAQLDAAKARLAKAAAREASRTARKSAKAVTVTETPKDRKATIKRGRWTYAAVIDGKTGWATYTKKLTGEAVHVAPTDFQEV